MPSFSKDVSTFVSNHKCLCIGTLGIAVGIYAVGNLCGRAVKRMRKCNNSTTEKTDSFNPTKRESIAAGSTEVEPARMARPKLKNTIPTNFDLEAKDWLESIDITRILRDLALEFPEIYLNKLDFIISDYSKIQNDIIEDLEILKASPENDQKKFLIYPINFNQKHWVLALIDRDEQTIEYYDSLLNYGPHKEVEGVLKEATQTLNEKGEAYTFVSRRNEVYSFVSKMKKAMQGNSIDCGAWILYFAEQRVFKGSNFTTELQKLSLSKGIALMRNYRKEISARAYLFQLKMIIKKTEENMSNVEEDEGKTDNYKQCKEWWLAAKKTYADAVVSEDS